MVIPNAIDPAFMPSFEVNFFQGARTYFFTGKVLFFSAHGGHWASDDREFHFVAVYDASDGSLKALLNMAIVQSVTPDYQAEEGES